MALIGEIAVNIVARTGQFTKGINAARKNLMAISRQMAAVGTAATVGFGFAIKKASDFQETMSKFNTVFGESAKTVKAWSESFAQDVGRSRNQIAGMLASTQDLFVPMGFAADEALQLSKNMTKLAVDLGSFNNVSDDVAILDLHRALTGGGEVMKKYGVVLDETTTKQELLNMKLDPKVATTYQKVQARLAIIMRGTAAAQGDAIRTADGFANQLKRLKGNLDDTAVTIGQAVLPTATKLLEIVSSLAKGVASWAKENAALLLLLGKLGLAAAATSAVTFALAKTLGGVTVAVKGLTTALAFLTAHPMVLLATSIAAVGIKVADSLGFWGSLEESLFGVGKAGRDAASGINAATDAAAKGGREAIQQKIDQYTKLVGQLEGLAELAKGGGGTLREPASAKIARDLQEAREELAHFRLELEKIDRPEREAAAAKAAREREAFERNRAPFTAARRRIHGGVEAIFGGRVGATGLVQHSAFDKIAKVLEAIGKIPTDLQEVTRSQNDIIQRGSQEAIAFARQQERRGTESDPGKQTAKNTKEMVKGINGVKTAINDLSKVFGREPVFSIPAS